MTTALNGTDAGCRCFFYERAPKTHDLLLNLEEMSVPRACEIVCALVSSTDDVAGESLFADPDDFGRFVGMHNWQDPAAMYELSQRADSLANEAWPTVGVRKAS